jgi:hypothetical protein
VATTSKIDAITLTGRSGKSYPFRIYVWETKFKSVAGIYVVASRAIEPGRAATYEPLFIGHSADLSKAFKDHPRGDCFQLYYANVIGVIKEANDAARAEVVDDLVAALAPPCHAADAP